MAACPKKIVHEDDLSQSKAFRSTPRCNREIRNSDLYGEDVGATVMKEFASTL